MITMSFTVFRVALIAIPAAIMLFAFWVYLRGAIEPGKKQK